MGDNVSTLKVYDCRQKNYALILDSSEAEIAGRANWSPNFDLLTKCGPWRVGTVWGKLGFRSSGICLVDLRKPLSKIIVEGWRDE